MIHATRKTIREALQYLSSRPSVLWIFAGFLIAHQLFFITPIFLNTDQTMEFPHYVPRIDPIGRDLERLLGYCESWAVYDATPYIGKNLYPPLAVVFFSPLLLTDIATAYRIMTALNVILFVYVALLIPLLVTERMRHRLAIVMLLFVTGLTSYGLQFELERGQFNILATAFCLSSICLYHYRYKLRFIAYLLFSVSIQLKVFPAIYALMFVKDWRDWKGNLKKAAGLAAFNIALLFVLGHRVFIDFIGAIRAQAVDPYVWIGNHSISSFVTLFKDNLDRPQLQSWEYMGEIAWLMRIVLYAFVATCLLLVVVKAYRNGQRGLNPVLLLACTVGASVIPSVSHDYKLTVLAAPVAIALCAATNRRAPNAKLFSILLLLAASFTYFTTLYPYSNKPLLLKNNLPMLMMVLFLFTLMFLLGSKEDAQIKDQAHSSPLNRDGRDQVLGE